VALTEPKPGVYVFDLGVNTAGWARLETRGKRGQKVRLEFNEPLGEILKGEGIEVYEPRFTYHGFRYVQVTGLAGKPTLDSLTGRRVHTDPEPAGRFSCSNPLVNRIHETIVRTQLTNMHGIPTDCPHREKLGWTGDGCITMEEAIYNFRMATFYTKWWRDIQEAQDDNGHACPIAPSSGWGRSQPDGSPGTLSDPWWGGAIVRTPWQLYRYYGDRRILEEAYEPMQKYLAYVATQAPGHISWANEGDWLEVDAAKAVSERTPPELAGTAAYYYHAKIVAEVAALLGRDEDSRNYVRLAEDISTSFHERYFDPAAGLYADDSQTAPAMALYFGMTPPYKRRLVLGRSAITTLAAGLSGRTTCSRRLWKRAMTKLRTRCSPGKTILAGDTCLPTAPRRSGNRGRAGVLATIRRWAASARGSTRGWAGSVPIRPSPPSSASWLSRLLSAI